MELVLGHSAAKAARDQGCSSLSDEALAHAQRAFDIAREHNRPDLEEKAKLGKAEFLFMMGRKRESLEVEIVVAAKAENMEIEQGADGQVVSVGGVSMDEVARRLGGVSGEEVEKHDSLEVKSVMAAKVDRLTIGEGENTGVSCVSGVPLGEVTMLFVGEEVGEEPSSSFLCACQHKTRDRVDTAHAGSHSCAGSYASSDTLRDSSVQGRHVRDVRGHIITVASALPKLKRKPVFERS